VGQLLKFSLSAYPKYYLMYIEDAVADMNLWFHCLFMGWMNLCTKRWLTMWLMLYVVTSICSQSQLISENTKLYNHLSHISLKIILLCNYTFLPVTVEVLGTFLEAILWKPL
jgi:hypothetical protein